MDILNKYKKSQIIEKFPELQTGDSNSFISIFKYCSKKPECFYNREIFSLYYNWLKVQEKQDPKSLAVYLENETNDISNAIKWLNQINDLNIHDDIISGKDGYNLLENIDKDIHPNYLKLVEDVFAPLIRLIAYFSRKKRKVKVEDMDLFNMVKEIQDYCLDMITIIQPYHHIIRNGIAHNGIDYLNQEIKYTDKKNNSESFHYDDVIKFFDNMIDNCNGMMLALKIFLINNKKNNYKVPFAFLVEELIAQVNNKWVEVNNCIPMIIKDNISQLLIYSFVRTTSFTRASLFVYHIAALAESLLSGYGRYFVSIRSDCILPGWFSFRGEKLELARLSPEINYNIYSDVIDDSGFFFQPRIKYPKLFYQADLFWDIFKSNYIFFIKDLKDLFQKANISIVSTEIHKNGHHVVVNADIVLKVKEGEEVVSYIKSNYKKIVAVAARKAKRNDKIFCISHVLPLGFARVNVYLEMARKRALKRYDLRDKLLCTLQFKNLPRIQCPDIVESVPEKFGLYRIMWNKKWFARIL